MLLLANRRSPDAYCVPLRFIHTSYRKRMDIDYCLHQDELFFSNTKIALKYTALKGTAPRAERMALYRESSI